VGKHLTEASRRPPRVRGWLEHDRGEALAEGLIDVQGEATHPDVVPLASLLVCALQGPSEVKDSHDWFANIEISYLRQRMEAPAGRPS
jgi:hypothetical protein